MFFRITLYLSLIISGLGTAYKVLSWFRCRIGDQARDLSPGERVSAALRGIGSTLFSRRILDLIKIGLLEVLLLRRLFQEGFSRWFMHLCLAYGFLSLLLLHALDRFITQKLFPGYFPTLQPFLFLRNFFGALVLVGLAIAVYRRLFDRVMRQTTRGSDIYAIVVLALIILSGFFLEAAKIVSHQRFQEMVVEYSTVQEGKEAQALRAYWAREFAVVFPDPGAFKDPDLIAQGKEVHLMNCASCHSQPAGAFVSYGLAKAMTPLALGLTRVDLSRSLWYLHFLVCFLGLALLPFTKFFHILTSPLVLLINGVMDRAQAFPANIATVRAIELDACTHCALCSEHCSVRPIYRLIPNPTILPSEKLEAFRAIAQGKKTTPQDLAHFQEGASICTGCYRGTQFCPVGIVAQELWFCMREDLQHLGCPDLFIQTREAHVSRFDRDRTKALIPFSPQGKRFRNQVLLSLQGSSFYSCFECVTCTNSCPVVVNYQNPLEKLGLLPHQIMHSLKFGLQERTLGAGMVWDCLGCYNCQENCPQGIRVTDILFELKNIAFQRLKEGQPGWTSPEEKP